MYEVAHSPPPQHTPQHMLYKNITISCNIEKSENACGIFEGISFVKLLHRIMVEKYVFRQEKISKQMECRNLKENLACSETICLPLKMIPKLQLCILGFI